jgi:hypothetical protein
MGCATPGVMVAGVQRYYQELNARILMPTGQSTPIQYTYVPLLMGTSFAHYAVNGYLFVHHTYMTYVHYCPDIDTFQTHFGARFACVLSSGHTLDTWGGEFNQLGSLSVRSTLICLLSITSLIVDFVYGLACVFPLPL